MPAKRRSSEAAARGAPPGRDPPGRDAQGPARVHVHEPGGAVDVPAGVFVLGHGAGGGVAAPDLRAAVTAATAAGCRAILVEQPWRVAGRRVAPAPPRLDEAWLAVLAALREPSGALVVDRLVVDPLVVDPLVVGGRSAGARVACRTAVSVGAAAAVCLAFPLHPPGRPAASRAARAGRRRGARRRRPGGAGRVRRPGRDRRAAPGPRRGRARRPETTHCARPPRPSPTASGWPWRGASPGPVDASWKGRFLVAGVQLEWHPRPPC